MLVPTLLYDTPPQPPICQYRFIVSVFPRQVLRDQIIHHQAVGADALLVEGLEIAVVDLLGGVLDLALIFPVVRNRHVAVVGKLVGAERPELAGGLLIDLVEGVEAVDEGVVAAGIAQQRVVGGLAGQPGAVVCLVLAGDRETVAQLVADRKGPVDADRGRADAGQAPEPDGLPKGYRAGSPVRLPVPERAGKPYAGTV